MITCRPRAGLALAALLALPSIALAQDGGFPGVPDVPAFDVPVSQASMHQTLALVPM